MQKNIAYLFSLLLILSSISVFGQTIDKELSLNNALILLEENNFSNRKSNVNVLISEAEKEQSLSVFLPKISLSSSLISTTDPLSSFGFKLKQENVSAADFDPSLLNNPDRIENFSTQLKVEQPLFNLDGIYARKAAKDKYDAVSFQNVHSQNYSKLLLKKAYYELSLAFAQKYSIQKAREQAKENKLLAKSYLDQGLITKNDFLASELHFLSISTMLSAYENNVRTKQEVLAHILGSVEYYMPIDSLQDIPLINNNTNEITNRSDFKAYASSIEARSSMLKMQKMNFIPRLNAFGIYELNDAKLMGNSATNYMIGASLNWTLFAGAKNIKKVKQAKAELNFAKIELEEYANQQSMEIIKAERNIKTAKDNIELALMSKKHAKESEKIFRNRYNQGLEKLTDLLQAELVSTKKEQDYLSSLFAYHMAVYYKEFLNE